MKWTGLDQIQRNLNKALRETEKQSLAGLVGTGLQIKKESMKLTPEVEGNLRGSAYVTWSGGDDSPSRSSELIDPAAPAEAKGIATAYTAAGKPTVAVGYAAIYAARVHENPRAGKTGGVSPSGRKYLPPLLPSGRRSTRIVWSRVGQWKFLETPFKRLARRMLQNLAKSTGKVWR